MNIILCEKSYFNSSWCKQILQGLERELKKHRVEYRIVFENASAIKEDTLFIIGSGCRWISDAVYAANACDITPIVIFNQLDHIIDGRYHSVSSDINGLVYSIADRLKKRNKKSICLYGVNPTSISDISRSRSFMRVFADNGRIFTNNGSLKKCFENFVESSESFDAVICTNDFAAISFVKNMMDYNSDMLKNTDVLSCSQSSISRFYSEYIESVNINFASFGVNAYQISRLAKKGEKISEISIKVMCDTDFNRCGIPTNNSTIRADIDNFYDDSELAQLLGIDRLIEKSDEVDKIIIEKLLKGSTYSEISQECYLSEQSVKYRVKRYFEICRVCNRRELASLFDKYHITM